VNDVSLFDPQSFLDSATTEQSTRRPPLPAGLLIPATISDVTARNWSSNKGGVSRSGVAFDVKLALQVPQDLVAKGQPETVTLSDSVMLDLTDGGSIDYSPGRNNRLRLYREAAGCNTPGSTFTPRMLVGRNVMVKIGHRPYQDELYEEVAGISKA
jgi:hypothetical protein